MIDLSLLDDFISGAGESLDEMEMALLELEIKPNNNELFHTIFRSMHTIKGAAQFVGLEKVSALSHITEDLLDLLREGKKPVTPTIIELLIQTKDRISQLIVDLEKTKTEIAEVDDLIAKIKCEFAEDTTEPQVEPEPINEEVESELAAFIAEDTEATQETEDIDLASFLSENTEPKTTKEPVDEIDLTSFLTEENESEKAGFALEDDNNEVIFIPEEEHDQELFSIYMQQLHEKTAILDDIANKIAWSHDKIELLNTAIAALESLKFSANYMGYETLTNFYTHWLETLLDAQEAHEHGEEVSFGFIKKHLDKLRQIFPQLGSAPAPSAKTDLTQATDNVLDALNAESSMAFLTDFIQQPEHQAVPVHSAELLNSHQETAQASVSEDEEDLYQKLSLALESSIEKAIVSEPINEVFSTLLAASNAQKAKTAKEEMPVLKVKTLAEANQEPEPEPEIITVAVDKTTLEKTESRKPEKTTSTSTEKALKKSIRVDADKIDALMNQVGELIVDRAYFFQLANEINELQRYLKEVTGLAQKDLKPVRTFAYRFSEAIISLGRTSNELQEGVMKVRMLPISQLFNRYPRLVHDLAHTNHKKVQLEIRGEETELDKMIIEEISDPLIHMIRNAIGHGIETPEERVKAGKPEIGTLILEAYHESNHIVIEVTDDGRGIDTNKIKAKAEEMNIISTEELNRMSSDDLIRFVMLPGFSTAKQIDSTSGRGVGMDVVKKNIEKLNGTIEVESKLGFETKIRLKIPLTLAIIQALLVKVGEDSFTIPLANVEETLRVAQDEISLVEDTEVMYLRGKTLPIFRLSVLFNLKSTQKTEQHNFFVVVVNTGNQKVGLMVDALLGQEEVVIKPLVDYLHEQNCFSGATIIGDGRISLILDVYELINMATASQVKKHQEQERRSLASLEGSA